MPHSERGETATEDDDSQALERRERIRIKNRRKMYLDRNPDYFKSPDLELADPLLYDRCVRRFQSAAEREADGKSKGYSGVLEADLFRSEAKLSALKGETLDGEPVLSTSGENETGVPFVTYGRGQDGEVLPEEADEVPASKEEGFERWKFAMTVRFLRGGDEEFEYREVDESEAWDVLEMKEEEEKWFDEESPGWVDEVEGVETLAGETGIQDF